MSYLATQISLSLRSLRHFKEELNIGFIGSLGMDKLIHLPEHIHIKLLDQMDVIVLCITTLTVLTNSASIVVNNFTICDGDSVVVDSNSYFTSGTYVDSLINNSGCDSIITTHLIVQTPTYQSFTICDGDSIAVGTSVYNSQEIILIL